MEEIIKILLLILKALGYALQAMADFFLYYTDNKYYKKHTFWYVMGLLFIVLVIIYILIFRA